MADNLFSDYLANRVLNTLRNVSGAIATVYMSLHTAAPSVSGSNEVAGGSYARQTIAFNAASGRAMTNNGAVTFSGMPTATVTHFGLWDAASGGNFLGRGALTASKSVTSGDSVVLGNGDMTLTLPATY